MKKIIFSVLFVAVSGLASSLAMASGAGVPLLHIQADHSNKESLQNGAKIFTNYCMGCHSLKYMRYGRIAEDLGIPEDLMQEHLNFSGSKIGQLMTIAADEKQQKQWFGSTPPDLSLITRLRGGPDWLYTYMLSFYKDDSRPYGVNNTVFKDVGMPHVMLAEQGVQECHVEDGHVGDCHITAAGSMTDEEYEIAVYDLANFLDYVAEPYKSDRKNLGFWVLLYVALFTFVAILLNREFWRDVH